MKNKKRAIHNGNNGLMTPAAERYLVPFVLALLVWIAYSPVLSAGFINWDDPSYIQYNDQIRQLGWHSIRNFFSSYYLSNYHPLTMLVYSVEYALFGLSPKGYHAVNLLLHISNTLLVYFIFRKIDHSLRLLPALIALLFGIHPMHVESVAWVSELKDQLYTVFMLISLLFYMKHKPGEPNLRPYLLSLVFFVLSLFSKGQAVVLPLVLIVFDLLKGKKPGIKLLADKIPFLVLSLIFGVIALLAQGNAINEAHLPLGDQMLFRFQALLIYLVRSVFTYPLSGFHEYPYLQGGKLPFMAYVSPLILIALLVLIYRFRKMRYLMAGSLLFFLTLLPLLVVPVGKSFIAERYTYIPYLGLFLILAGLMDTSWFGIRQPLFRKFYPLFFSLLVTVFIVQTYSRATRWNNSKEFWTDVLEKYPASVMAHEHLAMYYYYEAEDVQSAISETEAAILKNPGHEPSYRQAGFFYQQAGDHSSAIARLDEAVKLDSTDADAFFYRAISRKAVGNIPGALNDYSTAIRLDPSRVDLWNGRGALYLDNLMLYPQAISDFKRALKLDSKEVTVLYNLAVSYYKLNNYDSALFFAGLSSQYGYSNACFISALAWYQKHDKAKAKEQAELARDAGIRVPDSLMAGK